MLANFSFYVFMDRNEVELHKNVKGQQGQYRAILTELTKGFIAWHKEHCKKLSLYLFIFEHWKKTKFYVFYIHPEGEMTENLFTVAENILRKKTFIQLLGLR